MEEPKNVGQLIFGPPERVVRAKATLLNFLRTKYIYPLEAMINQSDKWPEWNDGHHSFPIYRQDLRSMILGPFFVMQNELNQITTLTELREWLNKYPNWRSISLDQEEKKQETANGQQ